jgi:hypothetical protein
MLTQTQKDAITRMRREWEDASGGDLLNAKGNVGLMFADVSRALDLTEEEKIEVLGANLYVNLNGNK